MFNISTKIAAACTLAALLAGCGSAHSASPPKQADDGGNFWSTYVKELTSPASTSTKAAHEWTRQIL